MELISEATGSRKEAGAKDPPSCQSKTMGVPGHEVIALVMLMVGRADCPGDCDLETEV